MRLLRSRRKVWEGVNWGVAVSLAMSRDNSSGGCIRLAVVTEEGVERLFVPGSNLPQCYM
jgi:hypothetical protein